MANLHLQRNHYATGLEGGGRRGYGFILLASAAAHADRTDNLAVVFERYPAREDHDSPFVRRLNAEGLTVRLSVVGQFLVAKVGRAVNALLMEILMLPIQASFMRTCATKVATGVDDRDVTRLPEFAGLLFAEGRGSAMTRVRFV